MMQINKEKKKILNKILSSKIIPPDYFITIYNKNFQFKIKNPVLSFDRLMIWKSYLDDKIERKLFITSVSFIDKRKYIYEYLSELNLLDLQFIKKPNP